MQEKTSEAEGDKLTDVRRLRKRVLTSTQVLLATDMVAKDGGPIHAPNEGNYKQPGTQYAR